MIRNSKRLLFSGLGNPSQFDVASPLRKDEEAESLEDGSDLRPR